ncbi:DUF6134 family protein [Roseomonas sp. BN140053]|uniref:DUF6134 family protein n=1 Tax=Roseomonas sp. BN140053 TaxID=3391898 RepID=UPI0039E74343
MPDHRGAVAPVLRRGMLGLLAALPLLPRPAGAVPARGYNWKIIREGSQIGSHRVTFSADGARRSARSQVEIAIRLAGFTVFRYGHDYTETWEGDRLVDYRSHSERQGRAVDCTVRPDGGGLLVAATAGAARLPRDAAPLSWWDPAVLSRPVFDTTTGKLVEPKPLHSGNVWRLLDAPFTEASYDAAGNWTGYTSRGDDGTAVHYEAA